MVMPVPDTYPGNFVRCPVRSVIDGGQCTRHQQHVGPCKFNEFQVIDSQGQRMVTERPDWLPEGHAFCPGDREEVRKRMYLDGGNENEEQYSQMFYRCEHGSWDSQADAWTAHAQFEPVTELVAGGPEKAIDRFLSQLELLIEDLRKELS